MKQPAFEQAEFETIMTQRLARSEERLSDPRARGMNAMSRAMNTWPEDDIRYVPTLEESIERLKSVSLGHVRDLYHRFYGADHLSISIVGDFDEAAVVGAIEEVFGDWKVSDRYERVTNPYRAYEGRQLTIDTPDKQMAVVGMSAAFEMRDDHPDYPALTFASYILGPERQVAPAQPPASPGRPVVWGRRCVACQQPGHAGHAVHQRHLRAAERGQGDERHARGGPALDPRRHHRGRTRRGQEELRPQAGQQPGQ